MFVRQIFKSLTGLVGLALFAYLFIYYAAEFSKVWNEQKSGTIHSATSRLNDRLEVFTCVDLRDFPNRRSR